MADKTVPTADELLRLFSYDEESGLLTRLTPHGPKGRELPAGSVVTGGEKSRDVRVRVFGIRYKVHQIVWCIKTGTWPTTHIDHRDLNPKNNRWDNLRSASRMENSANSHRRRGNQSGFKGVIWDGSSNRWKAQLRTGGRNYNLGRYACPEEAHAAYCRAAVEQFGEFARFE